MAEAAPPKKASISPSDFIFGSTLGEGAYARVVHAKMKRDESRDYAVKIMAQDHIKKQNKVKYILMERTILTKVSHQFIIRFYFSFKDTHSLYMCMDLAPGGELLHYIVRLRKENEEKEIENTALSVESSRFYASEIVCALEYLHRMEIIHRDLKPENILIGASGHIKITDFGTSLMGCKFDRQLVAEETEDNNDDEERSSFVGTAEYVSPEVLLNQNVSRSCDLWALGCIIYQMLVGVPPFRGPSEYLTFQTILGHNDGSKPLTFPPTVNAESADIINKLLVGAANDRLGAGNDDSPNDYAHLKSHPFFAGLDFTDLQSMTPPFVPEPMRFKGDAARNDDHEDWELGAESIESMEASKSVETADDSSRAGTMNKSLNSVIIPHLEPDELVIFSGLVYKRKGLFTKKRLFVLTNKPKIFYLDPTTYDFKGTIPWTDENPVSVEITNANSFDIVCSVSGRKYHLTDSEKGSQHWAHLINDLLARQKEKS